MFRLSCLDELRLIRDGVLLYLLRDYRLFLVLNIFIVLFLDIFNYILNLNWIMGGRFNFIFILGVCMGE